MAAVSPIDLDVTPTSTRWKTWFSDRRTTLAIDPAAERPVLMYKQQQRPYSNAYMPNGSPAGGPVGSPAMAPPGANQLLPNQGRIIQNDKTRILCVADVRGNLTSLNDLARSANADFILHTGDFGFYDDSSLDRIADKTLKHVAQYSPLLSEDMRRTIASAPSLGSLKESVPRQQLPLSQLPRFIAGNLKFDVPVYTVWGACEDVQVLERLRSGDYKVPNLHILDESHSRLLDVGGVRLRLLGLGGAVVMHKLFDNGEGRNTIAGGQGTMWTTLLQMGELVDTANRTYDPSETRIFITHASPAREGLLNQLAVALKADFSISGGLHFRYGSSYNEFSVNPTLDHFRGKLAASKASFQDVWETVKQEVEPIVSENESHHKLLTNALEVVEKMPSVANGSNPFGGHAGFNVGQIDEAAFKNMWNFNLADAAFGYLVLDIEGGRIGTEMKALGFNFAHRGMKAPQQVSDALKATAGATTSASIAQPSAPATFNQPPQSTSGTAPGSQGYQQQRNNQVHRSQDIRQQGPPQHRPGQSIPSHQAAPASRGPNQVASAQSPVPATNGAAAVSKTNGVVTPAATTAEVPTKSTSTPVPQEKSKSIFIQGVDSEQEARKLFSQEDQAKILNVTRRGKDKPQWVAEFESADVMEAIIKSTPKELTTKGEAGKPRMQINRIQGQSYTAGRPSGPSDVEGGRGGRGGTFGRRGGRGGGEFVDRGRGRGARGRGGFSKDGPSSGSTAPAPAATGPA